MKRNFILVLDFLEFECKLFVGDNGGCVFGVVEWFLIWFVFEVLFDGELLLLIIVVVFFLLILLVVFVDDDFLDFFWFVFGSFVYLELFDVFLVLFFVIILGVLIIDVVNVIVDGSVIGLIVVIMFVFCFLL